MASELTAEEARVLEMSALPTTESEIAEELGLEVWEARQLVRQAWSTVGVQNIGEARVYLQTLR
jgi:hypothetical protein